MTTVKYKGFEIVCSTAAEAAEVIARLRAEEAKRIEHRTPGLADVVINPALIFGRMFEGTVKPSHWTRDLFWKFLEEIGEPQKQILTLLVRKRKVEDFEMRKALKLESNQQLAGFLSGISKQAGAHNIPARAVYTIENESQSGEVTKSYVVATDFLMMATDQNWPAD